MSDRALLGRFLSSYLCYTKEKQFGSVKERGSIEGSVRYFLKWYNEIINCHLKQQKRLYKEDLHTVFQEQIACRLLLYPTAIMPYLRTCWI